jgi:transcriptional regulator with GAF, ATPase, and Fis domain
MIGKNRPFVQVMNEAHRVAGTDTTVLILGETGVGKEVVARAIHRVSPRRGNPFIRVDCSLFPETLITSELFGHEKGAFTGAFSRRIGRFELADGGTLFLDEIGDIPLEVQARLLRVIQSKEFERCEDIPLLAYYLLETYAKKSGKPITKIPDDDMKKLMRYDWPGNVRELENVVERAAILSTGDYLQVPDLEDNRHLSPPSRGVASLKENEKNHILWALNRTGWKVRGRGGAAVLGIHPNTLDSRMKKLAIYPHPSGEARSDKTWQDRHIFIFSRQSFCGRLSQMVPFINQQSSPALNSHAGHSFFRSSGHFFRSKKASAVRCAPGCSAILVRNCVRP